MRRLLHVVAGAGPPRAVLVALAGLSVALAATGCGGAIPSSNGGPAAVKLQSSKLGRFLVDEQGHTLYLFERDDGGESYCSGACASVWPPFETESRPTGAGGVAASALGTIKRDDGDVQVTYRGHPLYYYSADASKPGNAKGEDVSQFGSSWYLVGTNGKPVEPDSSGGSNENGGDNNGSGGGY
jgi:predicted lipoprotein with Yx(FWY)xxD motif